MNKKKKDLFNILGTILIVSGVAVWALYGVLRFKIGCDVRVGQFLPYHLTGVVPGLILRRYRVFRDLFRRLSS